MVFECDWYLYVDLSLQMTRWTQVSVAVTRTSKFWVLYFEVIVVNNFGESWTVNKKTCWDNAIASDNHSLGPSKDLGGLHICQDPHMPSLSVLSDQRTNENVHDLGATKQVTVDRDYHVIGCLVAS